ncbi:unnamed protein product [Pleuronectes platessa]|uniref:Uncharacterized protein n=1 Tax=Pleuronectes platessa TaxID=8262 RepID=A0A9N7VZE3_PLEPL|nr:unnamed protein product [Pleuronectes platessa]
MSAAVERKGGREAERPSGHTFQDNELNHSCTERDNAVFVCEGRGKIGRWASDYSAGTGLRSVTLISGITGTKLLASVGPDLEPGSAMPSPLLQATSFSKAY